MKTPKVDPAALISAAFGRLEPEQLGEVIEGLLAAETRGRDGTLQPDHRVRLETTRMVLGYLLGTPVQREHRIDEKRDGSGDDLLERLRSSPAMRRALRDALQEVEADS